MPPTFFDLYNQLVCVDLILYIRAAARPICVPAAVSDVCQIIQWFRAAAAASSAGAHINTLDRHADGRPASPKSSENRPAMIL